MHAYVMAPHNVEARGSGPDSLVGLTRGLSFTRSLDRRDSPYNSIHWKSPVSRNVISSILTSHSIKLMSGDVKNSIFK